MPDSTSFDSSLTFGVARAILRDIEGVHNVDEGGDTWWGVARKFHPNEPWPPTPERVEQIYFDEYWKAAGCDLLPPAVGIMLFDTAVNQGVDWAVRKLQQALGVTIDGKVGSATARAAAAHDTKESFAMFFGQRAVWYAGGKPNERLGLMARLFRVEFEILKRVGGLT